MTPDPQTRLVKSLCMDRNGFWGLGFRACVQNLYVVQRHHYHHNLRLFGKTTAQPNQPNQREERARARERDDEFCRFGAAALPERKKASRDQTISSSSSSKRRKYLSGSRSKNHNHRLKKKKKISLLETTTTTGRRRRRRRGVVDENAVSDFGSDDDDDVVVGWVCRTKTRKLCEGEEETNKYTQRGAPRFKNDCAAMVRKEKIGHESVRQPRGRSDDERRRKRRRRRRRKRRKGATRDRLVQVLWKKIVTGCGRE